MLAVYQRGRKIVFVFVRSLEASSWEILSVQKGALTAGNTLNNCQHRIRYVAYLAKSPHDMKVVFVWNALKIKKEP